VVITTDCPECQGSGWVRVLRDGVGGVTRCDCAKKQRADRLVTAAGIPRRYEHCELEGFEFTERVRTQSLERAKAIAERFVLEYPTATPFGLLFMGPPGIGKTHLAVSIVKRLMRAKSVPCLFRTLPDLLAEIRASYDPVSSFSEMSLLRPVLQTEALVLDELGAQNPSGWVKDTVAYILNRRYENNRVTILTTNYLDQDDFKSNRKGLGHTLAERIGEPMRSRLYEMCKTVVMNGDDFRKVYKQDEHRL
jgi:DNA replication protein DnaC